MIRTIVAMPTIANALLNVSSLSTKLATSPATPAVRPVPASSVPRSVRSLPDRVEQRRVVRRVGLRARR